MTFNLLMLALAGLAGASFPVPMKYFRGWRWEHVWIGQALTSNIAFPLLTLALLWGQFQPHLQGVTCGRVFLMVLMGIAWGVGGIGYGLCLVLLGLSFTYSLIFSVTTILGSLLPMWMGLHGRPAHQSLFGFGLFFCVAGILVIAGAAARREIEAGEPSNRDESLAMPVPPLPYKLSALMAVAAGIFSTAMGLSLAFNEDLVNHLVTTGVSPAVAPLIVWAPLGVGSGVAAILFGLWCAMRKSSLAGFYRTHPGRNWFLAIVMGALGFGVLLLYGLGSTATGHPPRNVSWAVYMSVFILSGNAIGVCDREWKNCSRGTYARLTCGITLLLAAIASLALS
jgi:L-rhamnose-H+ transport protein